MARAIRGSGLGGSRSNHIPDPVAAELASRQVVSFWCAAGHESKLAFADDVEAPELMSCRKCGAPAGTSKELPPGAAPLAPYKTHLQYMQERRTPEDAEALLAEALAGLRDKR